MLMIFLRDSAISSICCCGIRHHHRFVQGGYESCTGLRFDHARFCTGRHLVAAKLLAGITRSINGMWIARRNHLIGGLGVDCFGLGF